MSYYTLEAVTGLDSIEFQIYDFEGSHYFQFQIELNGKYFIKEYEIVGMLDELEPLKVSYGRDLKSELVECCLSDMNIYEFFQELKCYAYDLMQEHDDFLVSLTVSAKVKVCESYPYISFKYDDLYVSSRVSGSCVLVKENVTYKDLIEISKQEGLLFNLIMEIRQVDFIDI